MRTPSGKLQGEGCLGEERRRRSSGRRDGAHHRIGNHLRRAEGGEPERPAGVAARPDRRVGREGVGDRPRRGEDEPDRGDEEEPAEPHRAARRGEVVRTSLLEQRRAEGIAHAVQQREVRQRPARLVQRGALEALAGGEAGARRGGDDGCVRRPPEEGGAYGTRLGHVLDVSWTCPSPPPERRRRRRRRGCTRDWGGGRGWRARARSPQAGRA